jgi:hypothetical protein
MELRGELNEFVGKPALPYSGLSTEEADLASALGRCVEARTEKREFILAANESARLAVDARGVRIGERRRAEFDNIC